MRTVGRCLLAVLTALIPAAPVSPRPVRADTATSAGKSSPVLRFGGFGQDLEPLRGKSRQRVGPFLRVTGKGE
ncbi:hypothetical protein ACFQ08_20675, partial [Streptosporangium algeriense]